MYKNLLVLFFVLNAIFWSLFPHEKHCALIHSFIKECPSHKYHILFGIISFLIAVYICQKDYIDELMK